MHEPCTILVAEDDDGHAELIRRNLERMELSDSMVRLRDGQELLDYLESRKDTNKSLLRPMLLLLDLRMPRVSGLEVLQRLKADPQWKKLPIIVLTTTDDPREVEQCYAQGCNLYLTKPIEYEQFIETIQRVANMVQVLRLPAV